MENFAFLIHPIEIDDIYRKYEGLKYLPKNLVEKIIAKVPPLNVSQITDLKSTYGEAEGWFIGVPLTTKMMIQLDEEKVINKIIHAGNVAEKLGAKILGLGAYTSVVGDGGITVAENLNIAVTSGNTYTVAAAFEATKEALRLLSRKIQESEVAVVGANGSIGRVCAELACRDSKKVILIGRDLRRLEELKTSFIKKYGKINIDCSTSIKKGIATADAVITVTSSIEEVIPIEDIKSGAVVCDVARPRDVSKKVQEVRKDVLVIEGGVIEVPKGVDFNFNFGFPKGLSYACMAETMILALEKRYENFSLGRDMDIAKVDEITRLADKHGFKVAGLRSFERVVDHKYIEEVLMNVEKAPEVN
ncbi:shikimate/quinate 5-dehydrogenase/glutamyl-tRNA reductase [Clostridium aceticum]|uniref:Shikimate/quinate 5-dehydrogenase/glutamyl-tRNA reductase n=1 Tax=Clostridium aceticum TaxID=84022 RepID=A0A0D8I5C6_9CLOT|nr:shikimate dehydrogenase [Clostridium aceticum]AKL96945.1 shikimate/quinate 5-dehydrogenase/glutamyl-tRNA reductase [Clostridium aceticum]KJF25485.1 shikimate dehydrogenase [Clostridium aceticum]